MHVSTGLVLFRKLRHGNFSLCSWAWSQWAEHLLPEYLLFLNVPQGRLKNKTNSYKLKKICRSLFILIDKLRE